MIQPRLPIRTNFAVNDTKSLPHSAAAKFCAVCRTPFTSQSQLVAHIQTHMPFNCQRCSKSFSGLEALGRHWQRHFESPTCTACGQIFKGGPSDGGRAALRLKEHVERKDTPVCRKLFENPAQLRGHVGSKCVEQAAPIFCGRGCGSQFRWA